MEDKSYLSEKIGILKNEMTHLWGSVFVMGGGAFAFFFNRFDPMNIFWGSVGAIITVILLNAYFIRRAEILRILELLKEGK